MTLTLRLHNARVLPDGQTQIEMTGERLTIGRGMDNDLVLSDPERTLSKRHCVLEQRNGDYVLRDFSTNGTFLNYAAQRLDDTPTPLNHGDVILVGSFEMVVGISDKGAAGSDARHATPLPPMNKTSISIVKPAGAIDDISDTGADFLDDLLGGSTDRKPAKMATTLDSLILPDSADPFASDPSRGLVDGSSAPDHSPATQDHFAAPRAHAPLIPDDWADSFIQRAPQAKTGAENNPFDGPTAPPAARPAATSTDATDAALRAFLEGAGAGHINIPAAEVTQTMARMGAVMAAMIAGMREILMTRAAIKSEMRMNRTMINAGANNPLKFSISAEQAIEAMIKPSVRGYLDADAAISEALADVKAHEVATMSGMEAALKDLLARLGPDRLSVRIEAGSTLSGLLGNKKARYWEAYEKMYAQIAKETEDDFQSAFGKEFARAYEEQVKNL